MNAKHHEEDEIIDIDPASEYEHTTKAGES